LSPPDRDRACSTWSYLLDSFSMNWRLLYCLIFILHPAFIVAEVYTWVDEKGVTHYTSEKPTKNAKPAELPEIMKGEVKLGSGAKSCEQRGGINCQAGPAKDGSVICYDGFEDAAARYIFHCSSPRLKVSNISEVDENGRFSVVVRNSNSVEALDPKLIFKVDSRTEFELEGPETIAAFGVGEFEFAPPLKPSEPIKVSEAQLTVRCKNCSG